MLPRFDVTADRVIIFFLFDWCRFIHWPKQQQYTHTREDDEGEREREIHTRRTLWWWWWCVWLPKVSSFLPPPTPTPNRIQFYSVLLSHIISWTHTLGHITIPTPLNERLAADNTTPVHQTEITIKLITCSRKLESMVTDNPNTLTPLTTSSTTLTDSGCVFKIQMGEKVPIMALPSSTLLI